MNHSTTRPAQNVSFERSADGAAYWRIQSSQSGATRVAVSVLASVCLVVDEGV